jgi:hypothetical protein
MSNLMTPEDRRVARRAHLKVLAAQINGTTVVPVCAAEPVVAAPVPAPETRPDQTQEIADLMVKLEEKKETIEALVALIGEASEANVALETECKKHQADLASLLDMIFHSNPTTVVPAQTRPLAIMDRPRVRFCEPIEPFVPRFDSSESCV